MRWYSLVAPLLVLSTGAAAFAQSPTYKLGRTPTVEEIRAWDISVNSKGEGLPPGSGTAKEGAKIYAQKCALCHGVNGEGGKAKALVGGQGTLTSPDPLRTIGSFWPYATTVWDFINRAMPQFAEGSLSAKEVYSVTAFLLYKNGIIQEAEQMDAKNLPKVRMPNRDGLVPSWPD